MFDAISSNNIVGIVGDYGVDVLRHNSVDADAWRWSTMHCYRNNGVRSKISQVTGIQVTCEVSEENRQETPQVTWDRKQGQVTCQVIRLKIGDRKWAQMWLTIDSPYHTVKGNVWSVCWEYFAENWIWQCLTVSGSTTQADKQRVLMHRHQGLNVRHGLCHIYMRYLYIYELFIAFVCFVVCSLL